MARAVAADTTSVWARSSASRRWTNLVVYVVLVVLTVLFMGPFLFALMTSFKAPEEIFVFPPRFFPAQWRFTNYPQALFTQAPFPLFFRNTLLITVLAMLGQIASATLVAYGFARFRFPGRDALFLLVISTLILPEEVTIIPTFLTRDGQPVGPFGVMGGHMQPQGHTQVAINTIDYGMNPQAALDAPRWRVEGDAVLVELETPRSVIDGLVARGHNVRVEAEPAGFGRGQAIWRLHMAAHHAKRPNRPVVASQEGRDDRVVGTLARLQPVWVPRLQREPVAAVLQRDAPAGHDDTRAEAQEVRLDHAYHPPLAVGGAQVDGAAARRLTGRRLARGRAD